MKAILSLILTTAVLMILAGCSTTPSRMRNGTLSAVHTSTKSAKDIAICIAENWESYGTANQHETKNGYSVSANLGGKLHYLADIETHENAQKTKAYKFMSVALFGPDPFFKTVADCQ